MRSYAYTQRKGLLQISWSRFADLTRQMVQRLSDLDIDIVVGIARAGLFPATAAACMLRKELYPVRLTRRHNDKVIVQKPEWRVALPEHWEQNGPSPAA